MEIFFQWQIIHGNLTVTILEELHTCNSTFSFAGSTEVLPTCHWSLGKDSRNPGAFVPRACEIHLQIHGGV